MKYLDLPKPHGFLIWRGKQKAIASDKPLTAGESLLLISGGEAFGEVMLSQPAAMNLAEFESNQDYHCIRPEERKLYWPESDVFYVHRFKNWKPFEAWQDSRRIMPSVAFAIKGTEAELTESPELTPEQESFLTQAERLPKTLVLLDEAVTLEGSKTILSAGLDSKQIEPVIRAVFDGANLDGSLPLYQLALVRIPKMSIKKKEINQEELEFLSSQLDLMMENPMELETGTVEGEKCGPKAMYLPYAGVTTFADMMAMEEAQEEADELNQLSYKFQALSSNILSSPEIENKAMALKALADEYAGLVESAMAQKAYDESKWGSQGASREEDKDFEIEIMEWMSEWKEWAIAV